MRILAAVVVWVAAVAAAAGLSSAVAGSIHDTRTTGSSSANGGSTSTPTPAAPFDASAVKATDSDSLFQASNLARALAIVSRERGADAEVSDFVIYPGYLSISIVDNRQQIDFYIDAHGSVNSNTTGASPAGATVFPLSKIHADGPARIAARIAANSRVTEAELHYFVVRTDPVTGHFQWLVYPVEGSADQYFQMKGFNASRSPLFAYTGTGLVRIS
jgi:hypothetical protein